MPSHVEILSRFNIISDVHLSDALFENASSLLGIFFVYLRHIWQGVTSVLRLCSNGVAHVYVQYFSSTSPVYDWTYTAQIVSKYWINSVHIPNHHRGNTGAKPRKPYKRLSRACRCASFHLQSPDWLPALVGRELSPHSSYWSFPADDAGHHQHYQQRAGYPAHEETTYIYWWLTPQGMDR